MTYAYDPYRVIDLTGEQTNPPRGKKKHRLQGGLVVERDPATIDGITIHQTACRFGASARQIKEAGGDVLLAEHRRALRVGAHMTVFDTGYAVLGHPLGWYVNHGNGLNARSIGLEVEGVYPGILDNPRPPRWWRDREFTPLKDETLTAAMAGLYYLVEEGRALGMPLRYIWAHRQSSPTRRADPGEEIWRRLVVDFAVAQLRLETQPDLTLKSGRRGRGRPIPTQWDPQGVGSY